MLSHPILSTGGCIVAACQLQQGGGEPALVQLLSAPLSVSGQTWLWFGPLSWSCHSSTVMPDKRVEGQVVAEEAPALRGCWKDAAAQLLRPRGYHELSPSQLLFLITLTIATNSTRGPKVPVSCACSMVLNWGIWG